MWPVIQALVALDKVSGERDGQDFDGGHGIDPEEAHQVAAAVRSEHRAWDKAQDSNS